MISVGFLLACLPVSFAGDNTQVKCHLLTQEKIMEALTWDKIGEEDQIIATIKEGNDPTKKYFIVTDPPRNWPEDPQQADKVNEIEKWSDLQDKGIVRFEFAGDE